MEGLFAANRMERMSRNFINDIMGAVKRVVSPDEILLKEILIVCGMPESAQNLRYLSFNRQFITEEKRSLEFSAVAVINNRRISAWRLKGVRKSLSRFIFGAKWAYNPLDFFLNTLRCDADMMDILAGSSCDYTLLGILSEEETTTMAHKAKPRFVSPVVAAPGISDADVRTVSAFESANRIREIIIGFSLYQKTA